MSTSVLIAAGIAVFFNFIVLRYKFEHNKTADGVLDATVFIAIVYVTSGTMNGMVIGMIGSALFSLYGLWKPFNLDFLNEPKEKKELSADEWVKTLGVA